MNEKVLIVDDHPAFRAWARAFLESEGFRVVGEAGDGEGALAAARELWPEVVLLDIQLPGPDGFEVARRLAGVVPQAAVVLTSSRAAADYGPQLDPAPGGNVRAFIGKDDLSRSALERAVGENR